MIGLAFMLGSYYALIFFLFYKKSADKKDTDGSYLRDAGDLAEEDIPMDAYAYNAVHELLQELKDVFSAATGQQLEKEQILEAIGIRLAKYPPLKGSVFQTAITSHIEQQLLAECSLQLTPAELESCWE